MLTIASQTKVTIFKSASSDAQQNEDFFEVKRKDWKKRIKVYQDDSKTS